MADSQDGDADACAPLSVYCASNTSGITCHTTLAEAVSLLCAERHGLARAQSCGGYETLFDQQVDSSESVVFDSTGQLVGFAGWSLFGSTCDGVLGPACASPIFNPCPMDGGADGATD